MHPPNTQQIKKCVEKMWRHNSKLSLHTDQDLHATLVECLACQPLSVCMFVFQVQFIYFIYPDWMVKNRNHTCRRQTYSNPEVSLNLGFPSAHLAASDQVELEGRASSKYALMSECLHKLRTEWATWQLHKVQEYFPPCWQVCFSFSVAQFH